MTTPNAQSSQHDQHDLARRLETAIGDGPPPAPVAGHLRAGRRALLRRRIAVGAGAVGVLAVIGGVGLAAGGLDGGDDGDARVVEPAGQPAAPADPDGVVRVPAGTDPAVTITDGELRVADDVTLVTLTPNPLDLEAPATSYGVDWVLDGRSHWEVHHADGGTSGSSGGEVTEAFRDRTPTYEAFVADVVARWESGELGIAVSEPPTNRELQGLELVELGPDGQLSPVGATTILDQTTDVDLPDNFALPGDRTAAAFVVHDGYPIFVLARETPDYPTDYIHYLADEKTGQDLTSFLAFADTQYANEEGLR